MTSTTKPAFLCLRFFVILVLTLTCIGCASSRLGISVEVRDRVTNQPVEHAVIAISTAAVGPNRPGALIRTDHTGVAATTFYTWYEAFMIDIYVQNHDRHGVFVNRGRSDEVKTALGGPPTLNVEVTVVEED